MRDSLYRSPIMQLQTFQRVCNMLLTSSPNDYREASYALRRMHLLKLIDDMQSVCTDYNQNTQKSCNAGGADNLNYLLDLIKIYSFPLTQTVLHRRSHLYNLIYHVENSDHADLVWGSIDIWQTNGKSYSSWVSVLSYRLIQDFFCHDDSVIENESIQGFGDIHSSVFRHPSKMRFKLKDVFLTSISPLCLLQSDIAQEVFPLIVLSAVRSTNSNLLNEYLSNNLTKYVLSSECTLELATLLGCRVLHFMLRQSIKRFVKVGQKNKPAVKGLPYSFTLDIDFKVAASAAIRCKSVCSALLFAELSVEMDAAYDGIPIEKRGQLKVRTLNSLLIPIFREIHDPDAIYGVDLSSSLELQALLFSQKQQWAEALLTYESIAQSSSYRDNKNEVNKLLHSASNGIMNSLHGLGAIHTLSNYSSCSLKSFHGNVDATGSVESANFVSESIWRLGEQAALSLSRWSDALQCTNSLTENLNSGSTENCGFSDNSQLYLSINSSITSAIAAITCKKHTSALNIALRSCNTLFDDVLNRMYDETAHNVVQNLVYFQSLSEISEVCSVLSKNSSSSSADVLDRWTARQVWKIFFMILLTDA